MTTPAKQFVWDLPTRLFHWLLAGLFGFSWWSAESGEMEWHYKSGLALCFLVLFRLIWGLIGTRTSRFSNFVTWPTAILAHLRSSDPISKPGHTPLGAWSVVAMLAAMALQVTFGLFAVDIDGLESGPLSYLVSFDQGRVAAELHEVTFNILLALISIHLLAVLYYAVFKRKDLICRMITGKTTQLHDASEPVEPASTARFALAVAISTAITWAVSKGFTF